MKDRNSNLFSRVIGLLADEFRFSIRMLWRHPLYAMLFILTLGVGIGANVGIFSAIYAVLLRPLPGDEGDRIVLLHHSRRTLLKGDARFSAAEIANFRTEVRSVTGIAEYRTMKFTLFNTNGPVRIQAGIVSAEFFAIMGAKPQLGRVFTRLDDKPGAEPVMVLGSRFWREKEGSNPDILSRIYKINNYIYRVIGVLPHVPQYSDEDDVYILSSTYPILSNPLSLPARDLRVTAFARLRQGIDIDSALIDFSMAAARLDQEHPEVYPKHGLEVSLTPLREELTQRARPTLLFLLGVVMLLLLAVTLNLSNLSLARQLSRLKEFAVLSALGGGRWHLAAHIGAENAVLSFLSGILGLLLALGTRQFLAALAGYLTVRAHEIEIDSGTVLFTVLLILSTGLVCTLVVMLRLPIVEHGALARRNYNNWQQSVLVVAQLAISMIMLIGAGLILRSLQFLESVDPGFRSRHVLAAGIDLDVFNYNNTSYVINFEKDLLRLVRAQPGVISAAFASTFPLNKSGPPTLELTIEGQRRFPGMPTSQVDYRAVSSDYFRTLRMPLIEGRDFSEADSMVRPLVAVVSHSLVRNFLSQKNPLGVRISLDGGQKWRTIVGVVGDERQYGLDREPVEEVYVPVTQQPFLNGNLLVRAAGDPMHFVPVLASIVRSIDKQQPLTRITTLEDLRANWLSLPRLISAFVTIFSGLVLTVAATGLTGLMAFWVSRRTHEIGIRMALGSRRRDLLWLILRQSMFLVLCAIICGYVGGLALGRLAARLFFEVAATDPLTYISAMLLVVTVAGLACLVPMMRAVSMDPLIALRNE